jgi:hypothetical protein
MCALRFIMVAVFVAAQSACATQPTVTGIVVDTRGRPVSHALVAAAGWRVVSASERIVFTRQISTGTDGAFTFNAPMKINNISAISRDEKRHGFVDDPSPSGNVIVLR